MSKNVGSLRKLKSRILREIDLVISDNEGLLKDAIRWLRGDLKERNYFLLLDDAVVVKETYYALQNLESLRDRIESIFEEIEDEE